MILDELMCFLWISTYTLCFISTIKYRYPALSPIAKLLSAPFEFAVLFRYIYNGSLGFDYVSIAYLYWTLFEIALCIACEFLSNKLMTN